MSAPHGSRPGACMQCRRRAWLLAELSAALDFCASDRLRLRGLLALDDEKLLAALAGRRRAELRAGYEAFSAAEPVERAPEDAICRHCPAFPPMLLSGSGLPSLVHVAGAGDLQELGRAPAVAIVGALRASDYGVEMARSLARGVAATGVTVVSTLSGGVAAAGLEGALQARAGALAVVGAGLGVPPPAHLRGLHGRLLRSGCAVSELPAECTGRRWGAVAGERTVAAMAEVVVVVEADETPAELAVAELAGWLGRGVAAVPGRVTSPLSRGAHALLREGAHLVRGAQDVLELLYAPGCDAPSASARSTAAAGSTAAAALEPRLASVLARVGAGWDTPDKLMAEGEGADEGLAGGEVLCALSELEVLGLLARGEGGRYVPREPCERRDKLPSARARSSSPLS